MTAMNNSASATTVHGVVLRQLLLASIAQVASAEPSTLWTVPARGEVVARLTIEAELSLHRALEPVTLAPDLVIGLHPRAALVMHYSRTAHAQLGAGNGVCLAGVRETLEASTPRCAESETGLGIGGLVDLGPTTLRTSIASRGPGALAAELGAARLWRGDRAFAIAAPTVLIAITGRRHGNRERVQLATYAGLRFGRVELHLRSGLEAAFATFEDTFAVPLGAGASLQASQVRVGIEATFDRAFGPLNGLRERSVSVFVEARLGGAS
jgi:hypothetical protein